MGSVGANRTSAASTSAATSFTQSAVSTMSIEEMGENLRARNNGASFSAIDRQKVEDTFASMDNGTVIQMDYERGLQINYTKVGLDAWERTVVGRSNPGGSADRMYDNDDMTRQVYGGRYSRPDAIRVRNLGKSSSQKSADSIPNFVKNSKSSSTVVTKAGNMTLLDLSRSDTTPAHVAELERLGWRRRGSSDSTWVKS